MKLRTDPLMLAIILGCACQSSQSGSEPQPSATASVKGEQRVAIKADKGKFEPPEVHLKQGVPAILEFTRVVDSDCVNAVLMPWMNKPVSLPMNQKVEIPVDTSKAGTFTYSCWMNMVFGKVVIE